MVALGVLALAITGLAAAILLLPLIVLTGLLLLAVEAEAELHLILRLMEIPAVLVVLVVAAVGPIADIHRVLVVLGFLDKVTLVLLAETILFMAAVAAEVLVLLV
jgi:hypothetical protein